MWMLPRGRILSLSAGAEKKRQPYRLPNPHEAGELYKKPTGPGVGVKAPLVNHATANDPHANLSGIRLHGSGGCAVGQAVAPSGQIPGSAVLGIAG